MYDIDTIRTIKQLINKKIEDLKYYMLTGVDTIEELQYARGKYNAYNELLQDLIDLQKKEDNIYDIERKT
jgi:nicotinic acid mononucleotide adenylyltransferase